MQILKRYRYWGHLCCYSTHVMHTHTYTHIQIFWEAKITTIICYYSSGGWKVKIKIKVLEDITSGEAHKDVFFLSSYMTEGQTSFLTLLWSLIPSGGLCPMTYHLSKALYLSATILRFRFQQMNYGGSQTFRP